jgi:hypothetical protein
MPFEEEKGTGAIAALKERMSRFETEEGRLRVRTQTLHAIPTIKRALVAAGSVSGGHLLY